MTLVGLRRSFVRQLNLLLFIAVRALKIKNNTVKRNTVRLLENLGDFAKSVTPKLIELLVNEAEHELLRVHTSRALKNIGLTKYQDVEQLINFIEDPNSEVQQNIIATISTLREEADPIIPILQKMLSSEKHIITDVNVTIAVISCFGEIGEKAGQVVALLSDYLKPDKSANIRTAAAQSLARISVPKIAIPHLVEGLNRRTEELDLQRRIAFVNALAKSKSDIDPIVKELSRFIGDGDLKIKILQGLAEINSVSSIKILINELLNNLDPLVSNLIHRMDLGDKWEAKVDIILTIINQQNRSVQSYSNLEFPHLFYAMLPPSDKSISDPQIRTNVENLCQSLISKALENQSNTNLFDVVTKIITIGSRLETEDLKSQIDRYQESYRLKPEDLRKLRDALGDTSPLRAEISELNAQLSSSLKKYLEALNNQGNITLFQTEIQFKEILWMNRLIFGFGFIVGTISVVYFFSSLFSENIDTLKTVIAFFGSVAGIGSTFLVLFYKPQKQGQEAINNLSKSNVILGGFVFEMAHIAESLARLQSQDNFDLNNLETGCKIIRDAYTNALRELQNINKDLSNS